MLLLLLLLLLYFIRDHIDICTEVHFRPQIAGANRGGRRYMVQQSVKCGCPSVCSMFGFINKNRIQLRLNTTSGFKNIRIKILNLFQIRTLIYLINY